jgi:hypothetical protein
VQALCDAKLRFILISVLCPGKTNDWSAYGKSVMRNLVEALPNGFYILGDAAYVNSEHLLAPYPGKSLEGREDTFNYYQSQLRIRIEMAFARLVGRWGVFWRPLRIPLRDRSTLILATMKLHNYCIDEREAAGVPAYPDGNTAPPHVRVGTDGRFLDQARWHTLFQTQGDADDRGVRDHVADMMQDLNLHRPAHNLQRNANR